MRNKRIWFLSPKAYPLLAKTKHQSVGGPEVQQILMAKCLKNVDLMFSILLKIFDKEILN